MRRPQKVRLLGSPHCFRALFGGLQPMSGGCVGEAWEWQDKMRPVCWFFVYTPGGVD